MALYYLAFYPFIFDIAVIAIAIYLAILVKRLVRTLERIADAQEEMARKMKGEAN